MSKSVNLIGLIALFLFISINVLGQNKKRLTIKYSGRTVDQVENNKGALVFQRDSRQQVHFLYDGIDMWCDKAIYYEDDEFIEAYSNVRMKQGDTIHMTAKYIEYSGISQLAFASGNVVLREPQSTLLTDTLYMDRVQQQAYYETGGRVIKDTSGTITSNIGRYYFNSKKYQFLSDVVLVNPDYVLNTNRLDFYTEPGYAYLYGPSTITGDDSKIYCERGFYDTKNNVGHFQRNARIDYENRVVEGDSLYFDRNRNFASANNNIKVTDTINNSVVRGHYAEVFKAKDSIFITKRALAVTLQEKDSIYIHADTLMLTGPPEKRITRAYYDVRIYKSDLAGKSDSVHVNHETGLLQMLNLKRFSSTDAFAQQRKPILWSLDNQMTGDTIHLISNVVTEKLDTLKVFNNAFLISKDSLSEDGYNQVKGKVLIGLFRNNELYNVDINKNAEVIQYSRDSYGALIGINKSKSGSINIKLADSEIEIITLLNRPDGEITPESQFPENANKLRGFDWRGSERPRNVEDLFSDDDPVYLPKIYGLDDPEPSEEFFNEELMDRVNSAAPDDEDSPNKAARNIPPMKVIEIDSALLQFPKFKQKQTKTPNKKGGN
ncbi:OstA-like protein [Winogradskyella aurantiaca]|uniref:OstA-like protein n=1 Tax=Winogradskyella aurantiaca TaxID=2219558 RepID=UPI000E1C7C0B|nr:OstA-like protein [Winogradskyella aurantiaca]